jgi:hypothetical protein
VIADTNQGKGERNQFAPVLVAVQPPALHALGFGVRLRAQASNIIVAHTMSISSLRSDVPSSCGRGEE